MNIGISLGLNRLRGAGGGAHNLYSKLIAFWKLDESSAGSSAVTRNDSVGGFHLTDFGTVPSDTGLVYPLAASLTSTSNERLERAHTSALSPLGDNYAFAVWAYVPSIGVQRIVMSKYANADREFQLIQLNTNRFRFDLSANGTSLAVLLEASDVTLAAGNWYFVVCCVDHTNGKANVQVNAGTRHQSNFTGPVHTGGQPFQLGASNSFAQFTGRLGPVMVWRHYIPTEDDVTWLYNDGAGRTLEAMESYQPIASSVETLSPTITTVASNGYASSHRINSVTYRDAGLASWAAA